MSLKAKTVAEGYNVLNRILEKDKIKSLNIPFAGRLKLALNVQRVKPIQDELIKKFNELVISLGTLNPETDNYTIAGDSPEKAKFNKQFEAMSEAESGLEKFVVFLKTDLDGSDICADDILALSNAGLLELTE